MSLSFIPHSRPMLGAEEAEEAHRVVLSGMLAQGPEVAGFEQEMARVVGLPQVAALAHGTGALHLALLSLGAAPRTEVILPSYSCVSLLNAVAYTGATPVLVDCLEDAPDIDVSEVLDKRTEATRAVVVPHMFGRAVDLKPLLGKVPVLEDGTHGIGNPRVGQTGAACAYSFYATKMLAGGEGGALATRSSDLDGFARDHRSYDFCPRWMPRYNYKMTDLAAAILRVQLRRLPAFLQRRAQLAAQYRDALADIPDLILPAPQPGEIHYRFVVRLPGRSLENVVAGL
ncbi:unnamed protein product, partial [Phaeothamnion confervicola]